ncbi:hypothetical protein PPBDW_I10057 [Photobacterium kishitanii]|nr:hypothetical protein PPBDW_I10057 [Photobacterium kishitanii]
MQRPSLDVGIIIDSLLVSDYNSASLFVVIDQLWPITSNKLKN